MAATVADWNMQERLQPQFFDRIAPHHLDLRQPGVRRLRSWNVGE
jgi:hypothetical protein